MKAKGKRSFAVIGLGMFGGTVAAALAEMGDTVLGIDTDERRSTLYMDKLTQTVIADARDEQALREAGLANYDMALIAIGEDLEANILAAMNARLIGVKTVWAKAQSVTHHRILSRIGIDRVIHPEREMGSYIAETLHTPYVSDYISLGQGNYLVNIVLQEGMEEKRVGDFMSDEENKEWRIMGIVKKGKFHYAFDSELTVEVGDQLVVFGDKASLRKLGTRL